MGAEDIYNAKLDFALTTTLEEDSSLKIRYLEHHSNF